MTRRPPDGTEGVGSRVHRARRRLRVPRVRSVRVRITLTAVLLTTVAVGVAGWLLVRSVEDQQLSDLRDDIAAAVDDVSRRLAAGDSPEEAVEHSSVLLPVDVRDEDGEIVATAPRMLPDGRTVVAQLGSDSTRGTSPDGAATADESGDAVDAPSTATTATGADIDNTGADSGDDGGTDDSNTDATADADSGDGSDDGGEGTTEREHRRGGIYLDDAVGGDGEDPNRTAMLAGSDFIYAGQLETLSREVDTSSGTYTVSAGAPVEQVNQSLDALRGALVVGLPLLVVAVALTAWIVVRRALRPVEVIRAEVDAITGSTMHRRVPEPESGDEIDRLARTMNAMLDRLDRSAQRQRQFVADASHELRSPVAAIRTGLEVARHKGTRADWLAVADRALTDEARLESLLDDLLLLAAHDEQHGDDAPSHRPVDLAAITTAEAARPRPVPVTVVVPTPAASVPSRVAESAARLSTERDDDPAALVLGQRDQLTRVVANLLDNATRHARSAVEIAVTQLDDTVRLTVDDDGPGIAPEDRERVFERFTRLDDGRSRGEGGTGLGLALVRAIVTAHDGQVVVGDSPKAGARVTVTLPASP